MRTFQFIGTTVAAVFGATMLAGPAAQAATAPATAAAQPAYSAPADNTAMILAEDSIRCGKGLGGKRKVNFSWEKGNATTKIYFNNHCKKGKKITAAVVSRNYRVDHWQYWCRPLDTNGRTNGNKKFSNSGYTVWKVLRGHKNKYCKVQ
ncbi:hypothetical protein AB0J35_23030 [Nonomuraea angiospora]|uniref:hypothetical protein n=1 Tax=Nonomuraea angiospora TaxID=46172 RepID=UPI00343A7CCF